VKKTEVYTLEKQEKIDFALKLKDYGNALFKANRWRCAADIYAQTISATDFEDVKKMGPATDKEVADIVLACKNNTAACMLKLKLYPQVIDKCSEVLKTNGDNMKALLRRGQAYAYNKDNELAMADYKHLMELDPKNAAVVPYYKAVQKRLAVERAKAQKLFGGFFKKVNLVSEAEVKAAQDREQEQEENDSSSSDDDDSDEEGGEGEADPTGGDETTDTKKVEEAN